jgi:hypothetical protein
MSGRRLLSAALAVASAALVSAAAAAESRAAERCDPLDPAVCLFPWPNDAFTDPDASSPTGRRLALDVTAMPRNRFGKPVDPAPYNYSDGFSPGNMIITKVPGLDTPEAFRRTGAVPITDPARSFDPDQPVVVINARTLQRQLIWSELDANPPDPRDVNLLVRPAVNFDEGERYIVALRNLRDAAGQRIEAQAPFRALRDRRRTSDPSLERRRGHFEELFRTLKRARIDRKDLYLAWDFTVASEQGLTRRALSIRDAAFAELGDANLADSDPEGTAPAYVQNPDLPDELAEGDQLDGRRRLSDGTLRIAGRLTVPCFLDRPGCPTGSRFQLGADGLPVRIPGNTMLANVVCNIPPHPGPLRPSLYGHGLLGSAREVGAGNVRAMGREHGFLFCATDWAGMSFEDVPNVLTLLQDLSGFPSLADRAQQGFVNFMYLGRWMLKHDWSAEAATVDQTRLFYDGNSQGGIMGGALTALAPDFERAVLGVPGMNYSTLLRRSVDFDMYAHGDFGGADTPAGLYDNYPNELERPLLISLIQLLWDRGEANGYAHHMTADPLPNTPPHNVLMHVAFGDHQVADVTAEVEARTIGAGVRWPALDPGRHTGVDPFYGIPRIESYPYDGSALVMWDSGSPPSPTTNTPPRAGRDPHGDPRAEPSARRQKSEFLRVGGSLIDVCEGRPCYANGYTGTAP